MPKSVDSNSNKTNPINQENLTKNPTELIALVEAVIFSSLEPISIRILIKRLNEYFKKLALNPINQEQVSEAILALKNQYQSRAINLVKVSSGYHFEIHTQFSELLRANETSRNTRPSKAYLETLTLIAYRQPITRSEIEAVRGVTVSGNIVKDLLERDWICIAGHKQTPGYPALYKTTPHFLDSFHLSKIEDLPEIDFKQKSFDEVLDI